MIRHAHIPTAHKQKELTFHSSVSFDSLWLILLHNLPYKWGYLPNWDIQLHILWWICSQQRKIRIYNTKLSGYNTQTQTRAMYRNGCHGNVKRKKARLFGHHTGYLRWFRLGCPPTVAKRKCPRPPWWSTCCRAILELSPQSLSRVTWVQIIAKVIKSGRKRYRHCKCYWHSKKYQ